MQSRAIIAINSQTVPRADARSIIDAAGDAGFDGVELTGEQLETEDVAIAAALRRTGLRLLGACPTAKLHYWHLHWDGQLERRFRIELELAAALGAEYFVMPFMRDDGDADTVAAGLRRADAIAAEMGVRLAVEPIGHHAVLRRAEQLAPLLATFDPARVGLLLDAFHWFRAGHDVADLERYDEVSIVAMQISNTNSRPAEELLGYRDRTFPLDGRFPVTELCRQVLEQRPDTPVVVEVIGDVADATGLEIGVSTARRQLEHILTDNAREESTCG